MAILGMAAKVIVAGKDEVRSRESRGKGETHCTMGSNIALHIQKSVESSSNLVWSITISSFCFQPNHPSITLLKVAAVSSS